MTNSERLVFLEAKYHMVGPLVDAAEAQMLGFFFAKFAESGLEMIPPAKQESVMLQIDAKMEKLIVEWMVDEDEAAVRAKLKQQFGFSSFGEEPQKVLKRILREKCIGNEEEAKLVSDFLAGSYLGWDADSEKQAAFTEILGAYERRDRP